MKLDRIFCCVLLAAFAAEGAELFVAKSGNDANPGSAAAPFVTIAKAAAAAKPGDTVKIGPGLYREEIELGKKGTAAAPITFQGTRDRSGKYLTIIEAPGVTPAEWRRAPEIGPKVWKTAVPERPDGVLMDGKMIVYINARTMALPRKNITRRIFAQGDISSKFGKECKRIPGLDLLALPGDVRMTGGQLGKREESFFPTIGNVMAGWHKGFLYVRFADDSTPEKHIFSAYCGNGFTCTKAEHLIFKDLHVRASSNQFRLLNSRFVTIDGCLLMNGVKRVFVDAASSDITVKNSILTSGFIQPDHYASHSPEDKRGRVVYLTFKYIVGTALSDDVGVTAQGKNVTICGNVITDGLIGMQAFGPGMHVHDNVVTRMASCGIVTGPETVGEFHHNLVSYCGILQRFHCLRQRHAKRLEYHYLNYYLQHETSGTELFVHCESQLVGDDVINFEPGTSIYKKNPPKPVYPGDFFVYHNTFWGGNRVAPAFDAGRTAKRFNEPYPFCLVNNIMRYSMLLNDWQHVFDNNLLYLFSNAGSGKAAPGIIGRNKILSLEESKKIWNPGKPAGIPDITLRENSPALGIGKDVSKPFSYRNRNYPALPGFKPGYFKGAAPAAGALQEGEGMEHFVMLARKLAAARKIIAQP